MQAWVEQRQSTRQLVRIEAMVVKSGGLVRLPVTIVNLSRAGAMLELAEGCELPAEMVLLFKNSSEPCRTVWQVDRLAGVEFIDLSRQ
jgi:PilZ domain